MWVEVKDFKSEVAVGSRIRFRDNGFVFGPKIVTGLGETSFLAKNERWQDREFQCSISDSGAIEVWREPKRWRAEKGEENYYVISLSNTSFCREVDEGLRCDDWRYNSGNYFRTAEQAIEATRRVRETLMKYHEEIGE